MKKVLVIFLIIIVAVLFSCKPDPSNSSSGSGDSGSGGEGEGGSALYSENWKLVEHPVPSYRPMYVHINKPIMVLLNDIQGDTHSYFSMEFILPNDISLNSQKDKVRVVVSQNNSETDIIDPGSNFGTTENILDLSISGDEKDKLFSLVKDNNRLTVSLELKRENESDFTPLKTGSINCTGFYTNEDDIKKYNPSITYEKLSQLARQNGFSAIFPEG